MMSLLTHTQDRMRTMMALVLAGLTLLSALPTVAAEEDGFQQSCTGLGTCASIDMTIVVSNCTSFFCVVEFRWPVSGSNSLSLPGNVWASDSSGGSLFCSWTVLPSSCTTSPQVNGFIVARGSSVSLRTVVDACVTGFGTLNTESDCAHIDRTWTRAV